MWTDQKKVSSLWFSPCLSSPHPIPTPPFTFKALLLGYILLRLLSSALSLPPIRTPPEREPVGPNLDHQRPLLSQVYISPPSLVTVTFPVRALKAESILSGFRESGFQPTFTYPETPNTVNRIVPQTQIL
jgi:hypothetical protein